MGGRHQQKGNKHYSKQFSDRVCNQQVRSRPGYELGLSRHAEGGREGHEAPLRPARQEDMRGKALPLHSLIYSAAFQLAI